MQHSHTANFIQLITRHHCPSQGFLKDFSLYPNTQSGGRGGMLEEQHVMVWLDCWQQIKLTSVGYSLRQCIRLLVLSSFEHCHWNWDFFIGLWTGVDLDFMGGWEVEGDGAGGSAALMSWWPLWQQWTAQQGKWDLAWAQHSLLKLQKGWVATDGNVNNHSRAHANASWCTKHTPTPHPTSNYRVETQSRQTDSIKRGGTLNRWQVHG